MRAKSGQPESIGFTHKSGFSGWRLAGCPAISQKLRGIMAMAVFEICAPGWASILACSISFATCAGRFPRIYTTGLKAICATPDWGFPRTELRSQLRTLEMAYKRV